MFAVAAVVVVAALVVRVVATSRGMVRRRVLAWPPVWLDVLLVAVLVGAVAVAVVASGGDGSSWDDECPPAAPAEPRNPNLPRWPDAALPGGDDVASLERSTGVRIPQLAEQPAQCVAVVAEPETGGARVDARGWTEQTADAVAGQAARALAAAGYTKGVGRTGSSVFARSADGTVRASISFSNDAVRDRVLVTSRVVLGPEFVGACLNPARRGSCRLLYGAAASAAALFDPLTEQPRVRETKGGGLALSARYGVDVSPTVSPSLLEHRMLRALRPWKRVGGRPCYLPGRIGTRGCPILSPRSEPPRLPYEYRLTRKTSQREFRAAVRVVRSTATVQPRLVVGLRLASVGPVG